MGPPAETPFSLVPTDGRHPIFRLFDPDAGAFDQARFSRIATIATTAPSSVIARFDNGAPALVDQAMGKGRLGVFASDLSNRWNDLVLQPAFVPWVVETASWLAANHAAPAGLVAGDGASERVQPARRDRTGVPTGRGRLRRRRRWRSTSPRRKATRGE